MKILEEVEAENKSEINKVNNKGPRTEPWEMSEETRRKKKGRNEKKDMLNTINKERAYKKKDEEWETIMTKFKQKKFVVNSRML